MTDLKTWLTLAAVFALFLIGGNAEAADIDPCDYRPFKVCTA